MLQWHEKCARYMAFVLTCNVIAWSAQYALISEHQVPQGTIYTLNNGTPVCRSGCPLSSKATSSWRYCKATGQCRYWATVSPTRVAIHKNLRQSNINTSMVNCVLTNDYHWRTVTSYYNIYSTYIIYNYQSPLIDPLIWSYLCSTWLTANLTLITHIHKMYSIRKESLCTPLFLHAVSLPVSVSSSRSSTIFSVTLGISASFVNCSHPSFSVRSSGVKSFSSGCSFDSNTVISLLATGKGPLLRQSIDHDIIPNVSCCGLIAITDERK